jgi:hypothetical protein
LRFNTRHLAARLERKKCSQVLRGSLKLAAPAAPGSPRGLDKFRQYLAEIFQAANWARKRDAGGSIAAAEIDAFGIDPRRPPWPIGLALV